MLTLIALSAALLQNPPAPPPPPAPPEPLVRFMLTGPGHGAIDRDRDGEITREEFTAPMADAFDRMDADGDGRLSSQEMAEGHGAAGDVMMLRVGEPGMRHFEMRLPGPGDHHEIFIRGPGGEGGPHVSHFDAPLDADGDGKVSEAEFTARPREVFARLDADRSGYLEEGEHHGDGEVRVFTRRIERRDDD
ncbi:MAG: hypothetical protein H2038_09855 [Brevundimonas sp.]|jgi:hypothetical protein|uniref:hypothetical protein n=1 Tax=Brevundimonas sp. TaxID=1871086 RepID=UPI0017D38994|nr:hypothetical protein [Brevundimonas sp.]MBA4804942.1 hypothetical protein [Brevundimonas sp.]